jgi:hypothetical protein
MQVGRGWTAMAPTPTIRVLTWTEWCAVARRIARGEQCQQQGVLFSERELARLSFVRWLCQTGRLGSREQDDI